MPRLLRFVIVLAGVVVAMAGLAWLSLEQMWGDQIVAPPYDNILVGHEAGSMVVTGSLGEVWVEPLDDETWVVRRNVDGAEPEELFRGEQEDAQLFAETEQREVLAEGTEAEVEAWIAEHERGPMLFGPLVTVGAGVVVVLVGLLGARRSVPETAGTQSAR